MGNPLQFGNHEITVSDFTTLVTIAGPVGEQDDDADAIFLRFEQQTYTRDQVLSLVQVIARMQPDECEMSDGDLRLWWD